MARGSKQIGHLSSVSSLLLLDLDFKLADLDLDLDFKLADLDLDLDLDFKLADLDFDLDLDFKLAGLDKILDSLAGRVSPTFSDEELSPPRRILDVILFFECSCFAIYIII